MGERIGAYRVVMVKPEGKRQLGRPMHRWEDSIKMDLQDIVGGAWTASIWFRIGRVGGHL